MVCRICIAVLVVSICPVLGQVDTSYYPLEVGNYWEYKTARPTYELYSLFRQGIIDTVRIDDHLWHQQYSFWGVNYLIDLLRVDDSNNVLVYNETGTPDTLVIISDDYMFNSGKLWQVSNSNGSETVGYLSPGFQSIYIPPLGNEVSQCIQANYIRDGALFWSSLYAPNVGKVHVVAENVVSFLHSIRLSGHLYVVPPNYSMDEFDTIQFDINSAELEMISSEKNLFELSFNPDTLGWTNYSIYSIEFFMDHRMPIYEIDFHLVADTENFRFDFNSYSLDSSGYWDVFSEQVLPPLSSLSGAISLTAEINEASITSLLTKTYVRSSEIQSLMGSNGSVLSSLQVRFVFHNTTVDVTPDRQLPTKFSMSKPFPNPFNPSTIVRYDLPRYSDVSIKVIDLTGRVIWSHEWWGQSPGYHEFRWNGIANNGTPVSSGIYLIGIESQNTRFTEKVMLIR